MSRDSTEIWSDDGFLVRLPGTPAMSVGQVINVKRVNYRITDISWSIDDSGNLDQRTRQNVITEATP